MKKEWQQRWGSWIRLTKLPGVWEVRGGGFLVRRRVTVTATGRQEEIRKVLSVVTPAEALRWLEQETVRVRDGVGSLPSQRPRFSVYAALVFERKVKAGDITSPSTTAKWKYALERLIEGVADDDGNVIVEGLGDHYVDAIGPATLEEWRAACGAVVRDGRYDATTVNQNWIPILRGVLKAASKDFGIPNAAEHLRALKEEQTDEEPNTLIDEEGSTELLAEFLSTMRERHPQHYAMTLLGCATGLRPSHMRPLRRTGSDRDVLWDEGTILVRRSQTIGAPIDRVKTKASRQRLPLPKEVMDTLRWHVETQLTTAEQIESELLFPSLVGGPRSNTVLRKPFDDVLNEIGVARHVTAKGMRRTFNDLMRVAGVRDLVVRSISGHTTEQMQRLYSTATTKERREAIAQIGNVIDLAERRANSNDPKSKTSADKAEPIAGSRR